MPQAANVVINDGATTPVAHTFSPIGKDKATDVIYFEQTTPAPATPMLAKKIGYKQTRVFESRKQLTGMSNLTLSLHVPTGETLGNNSAGILPPPTLAYKETGRIGFELAERSTKQERRDTRILLANWLLSPMAVSAIDDLQVTTA